MPPPAFCTIISTSFVLQRQTSPYRPLDDPTFRHSRPLDCAKVLFLRFVCLSAAFLPWSLLFSLRTFFDRFCGHHSGLKAFKAADLRVFCKHTKYQHATDGWKEIETTMGIYFVGSRPPVPVSRDATELLKCRWKGRLTHDVSLGLPGPSTSQSQEQGSGVHHHDQVRLFPFVQSSLGVE